MHPIEHLRYVARARGADPASLVRETAQALSSMRFDPSGLVIACRRIVERHPDCAPLWWLCARLLTSPEPFELAWTIVDEVDDDATADHVSRAVPDDATVVTIGWPEIAGRGLFRRGDIRVLAVDSRHDGSSFVQRLERFDVPCDAVQPEAMARAVEGGDLVVVEASAASPERVLAPVGSTALVATAHAAGVPVWLVTPLGRRLPDEYVTTIADRLTGDAEPWHVDHDEFAPGWVTQVIDPTGSRPATPDAFAPQCPLAHELLRASPI